MFQPAINDLSDPTGICQTGEQANFPNEALSSLFSFCFTVFQDKPTSRAESYRRNKNQSTHAA